MKFLVFLLFMLVAAVPAGAQVDIYTCLEYMTREAPGSRWMLQDDGQGVYIREWQSTVAKPTKAEVIAVWPEAKAWKAEKVKDAWADLEAFDEKTKIFLKALVICINKRLPAGNKITVDELKTEARKLITEGE